ncbi:TPA: hypothetical protein M5K07_001160 [Citrobacter freundii]|nr:hypothetical protein [Citrobacter freundii]HDS6881915.1 hypothetical protein [Citrobacter freundii]
MQRIFADSAIIKLQAKKKPLDQTTVNIINAGFLPELMLLIMLQRLP